MSDQHTFLGLPEPTHRPVDQVIADAEAKGNASRDAAGRLRAKVGRVAVALLAVTNPVVPRVAVGTAHAVVEAVQGLNQKLDNDRMFHTGEEGSQPDVQQHGADQQAQAPTVQSTTQEQHGN
ncbi:MAG TPA: hypothetical protein PKA02_01405 [Candidatus Saccharibacteria bacterium]|nr:hypothetical protein [Candidatus Saccharibacteria bacterium]